MVKKLLVVMVIALVSNRLFAGEFANKEVFIEKAKLDISAKQTEYPKAQITDVLAVYQMFFADGIISVPKSGIAVNVYALGLFNKDLEKSTGVFQLTYYVNDDEEIALVHIGYNAVDYRFIKDYTKDNIHYTVPYYSTMYVNPYPFGIPVWRKLAKPFFYVYNHVAYFFYKLLK